MADELARWIAAQRIAILAYRQRLDGAPIDLPARLEHELNNHLGEWPHFIRDLPRGTLALLRALSKEDRLGTAFNEFAKQWQNSWRKLHARPSRAHMSPFRAVRLMADWIVFSAGDPALLPQFAKSVIGKRWNAYVGKKGLSASICEAVQVLRNPGASTDKRLNAVNGMSVLLQEAPFWSHIANILYYRLFSWPLLFSPGGAFTLPIGIDLWIDAPSEVVVDPTQCRYIDASSWQSSFELAVRAAKTLWNSTHRNCGAARSIIRHAGIAFRLEWADRIAEVLQGTITLDGRSMEAYLSQAILIRFLGNASSLSSLATGRIGAPVRRDNDQHVFPDFWLEWPDNVGAKMNLAFQLGFADRFVRPADSLTDESEAASTREHVRRSKLRQTAAVNGVARLSRLADCMHPGGWRQHKYIRCPDLGQTIESNIGATIDTEGVRNCLAILRTNRDPVLALQPNLTALDVAGALYHINGRLIKEIPLEDGSGTRQRPHPLSWAFLRVAPGEQDEPLWQLIWRITGSLPADVESLLDSGTSEIAAASLAGALNSFEPTIENLGRRAPDVLVLIGTRRLSEGVDRSKSATWRPLAFNPVLQALRSQLRAHADRPLPDRSLMELIGNTRIILLPDDPAIEQALDPALLLSDRARAALARLTIFRFGFTQQMAALVLGDQCPTDGSLQYFLRTELRLGSPFQGQYYLRGRIGQDMTPLTDPQTLAQLHYSAGCAHAPYLSPRNICGVARDRAFFPENVCEAEYHFRQSLHFANRSPSTHATRYDTERALERLQQFAGLDEWHVIGGLVKGRKACDYAHASARRKIAQAKASGADVHPLRFLLGAYAAQQRIKELRGEQSSASISAAIEDLRTEIATLIDDALRACDLFPESGANRAKILSWYAVFLDQSLQLRGPRFSIDSCTREVVGLINAGVEASAAIARWYEMRGDKDKNPRSAAGIYSQGIMAHPRSGPLLFKGAGTLVRAGADMPGVATQLGEMTEDTIEGLIDDAAKVYRLQYDCCASHVLDRWRRGIAYVKEVWASADRIRRLIEQRLEEHRCQSPLHVGPRKVLPEYRYNRSRAFICAKCTRMQRRRRARMAAALLEKYPHEVVSRLMDGYQAGRISMIKQSGKARFGFVRSTERKDYYFNNSDLARGVDFRELMELQYVQFEEAAKPDRRNQFRGRVRKLRPL